MGKPGVRFDLERFDDPLDRGRPMWVQALWLLTYGLVGIRWWFPNGLRIRLLRLFGATIGTGVIFRHGVRVYLPWKLAIGDHSWVGEGVWFHNVDQITVGDHSCISQGAFLCAGSHDSRSETFGLDLAPITIGDGVWIAAQATVLRGVTVGDNTTIGATALVVRSVPAGSTVLAPAAEVR